MRTVNAILRDEVDESSEGGQDREPKERERERSTERCEAARVVKPEEAYEKPRSCQDYAKGR